MQQFSSSAERALPACLKLAGGRRSRVKDSTSNDVANGESSQLNAAIHFPQLFVLYLLQRAESLVDRQPAWSFVLFGVVVVLAACDSTCAGGGAGHCSTQQPSPVDHKLARQ